MNFYFMEHYFFLQYPGNIRIFAPVFGLPRKASESTHLDVSQNPIETTKLMTDREIIAQLLQHDEQTTRWFFYEKCRPLMLSIRQRLFDDGSLEYDELVNELYTLLMEQEGRRLRQFDYRSSLCQWVKTVALHHFMRLRKKQVGLCPTDELPESPVDEYRQQETALYVEQLLGLMSNPRHAYVIRRLMLDQAEHALVAQELGVTTDNLYNMKRRAIHALAAMVQQEETAL